jgi:hypothetical protein
VLKKTKWPNTNTVERTFGTYLQML